jgi:hypothetical protein
MPSNSATIEFVLSVAEIILKKLANRFFDSKELVKIKARKELI